MSQNVKAATGENFESMAASGVVVVDFSAEWCGPCRTLAPVFTAVADMMEGQASFIKVDVDQAQSVAAQYQITSVPTVILLKDGEEKDRFVGVRDEDELKEWVGKFV